MSSSPVSYSYKVPEAAELVRARFEHSQRTFLPLFRRQVRWYDIYRGWWTGTFQSFRNNVTIPVLFSTVWTDVARKVNISLNTWPIVAMTGGGPEDLVSARKNEMLISSQMEDSRIHIKGADVALTGALYGTAITQSGWSFVERNLLRRDFVRGSGRRQFQRLVTEPRVMFDGPDVEVVDGLDFFPQPGRVDLEDMDWVIRRYYLDLDDLFEMSSEENPIFDREAVLEIQKLGMQRTIREDAESRTYIQRNPYVHDQPIAKYDRPVEILEMWGRVPRSMNYTDGATWRVISLANRQIPVRDEPIPFWEGVLPFQKYAPLRDPHYFHGIGKMEIGERLQLAMNRTASHQLDVMDLVIDPTWGVDINKIIDQSELYSKPGHHVRTDGAPMEVIQQITPDLSGFQLSFGEISTLWDYIQQGTAITADTVQGTQQDRGTARAFLGRQEASSIRLMLEARFFESMWLEPLAKTYRWLNRQFLPVPLEQKILGAYAITDPITGAPVTPEAMDIFPDDINRDYDVRARGSTQVLSKSVRQQNLVLLYQTLAANPVIAQYVNWISFIREMFNTFEMKNVDELMIPPPAMQQAIAAAGQKAPTEAPPGSDLANLLPTLPGEQAIGSLEGTLAGR